MLEKRVEIVVAGRVHRSGVGCVSFRGNAAAILRQRLYEMLGIIGEVVQNSNLTAQDVHRDSIVRPDLSQKLDHLPFRVSLILDLGVQSIEEDDGDARGSAGARDS